MAQLNLNPQDHQQPIISIDGSDPRLTATCRHLLESLHELQRELSVASAFLARSNGMDRRLAQSISKTLEAVAEFEPVVRSERVRIGLDIARIKGKRLGRPGALVDEHAVARAVVAGNTITSVAKQFGIARSTVREIADRNNVSRAIPAGSPKRAAIPAKIVDEESQRRTRLSEWTRQQMRSLKMTKYAVARAGDTNHKTVQRVLDAKEDVYPATLRKLAVAFNVPESEVPGLS